MNGRVPSAAQTNADKYGCVFVSLGARAFTADYFSRICNTAMRDRLSTLQVWLLDSPETRNLQLLYGLSADEAASQVAQRIATITRTIRVLRGPRLEIRRVSDLLSDQRYLSIVSTFRAAVANDRSLFDSYSNQCFQNLTPQLRRAGVRNRRHPAVDELADYLVCEDALRLYIADRACREYAPQPSDGLFERTMQAATLPSATQASRAEYIVVPGATTSRTLSVNRIGFRFETKATHLQSFSIDSVSLRVEPGHIVGLFGPSGSGKSTLLKLLAGHLAPEAGSILIGDHDITSLAPGRRGVVTVFQDLGLFPHLSLRGNVEYGLAAFAGLTKAARVELTSQWLQRLGILECANHLPDQVSGGQRQRAAIARGLVAQPEVLLLDEPTASLDHQKKDILIDWLYAALVGPDVPAVIIVSHDRDFLSSVCSHLAVIDDGQLLALDELASLTERPPSLRVARLLGTHGWLLGTAESGRFCSAGDPPVVLDVAGTMAGCNGPHSLACCFKRHQFLLLRYRKSRSVFVQRRGPSPSRRWAHSRSAAARWT